MTPLEQAQARMADPTLFTEADERVKIVNARMAASNVQAIADKMQKPIPTAQKVVLLKQAADTLIQAAKGVAPCKEGCSHCCHMATNITEREAAEMAKASGRKVSVPDIFDDPDTVQRFEGVPCPFLKDNRCSIYAARPFACRIHISMDRDSLLCRIIPGETIRTPTINIDRFTLLNALSYRNPTEVSFADIRQFFP